MGRCRLAAIRSRNQPEIPDDLRSIGDLVPAHNPRPGRQRPGLFAKPLPFVIGQSFGDSPLAIIVLVIALHTKAKEFDAAQNRNEQ